ncbi:putative nuclease HARBI1 [Photinus pyralis]|uniref:putative nuclease HARBI1 n=1 Tax=Photinus pyralis TaxID=7054 RepID=UPI001267184A|nr:putative nuclease HARBI1 [Photinus pyralis]
MNKFASRVKWRKRQTKMAVNDVNIFSESDSDEELVNYVNILYRRPYVVRQRPDHLQFWDDVDFINRFRLSKETVQELLVNIENIIRFPTNRNHVITPLQQLLICLRFYASGNMLITVGDFAGVHKSSVCHIIKRVSSALCTLRPMYVSLPTEEECMIIQQGFYRIAAFPRVLLALDCTHVKIQSPGGAQAEQFRNRKGNIVARWPGATHDSTIFNNSMLKAVFEDGMGNHLILGDSGYPLIKYLITPLLNPTTPGENRFNEAQIRTRNVIERAFGVWKRRFPVLALGLRLQLPTVQDIIMATAILHNIAIPFTSYFNP